MSSTIKQAIQALKSRVEDAFAAVEAKGGTLPATQDTANLPAAIASIPTGGGGNEADIWYAAKSVNNMFNGSTHEFEMNASLGIPNITRIDQMFLNSYVTKIHIASMPNVTLMSLFAYGAQKLKEVVIDEFPNNAVNVSNAFGGELQSLERVYIGGTMESITSGIGFYRCRSLKTVTLPQIGSPNNLFIWHNTFAECNSLENITMLGDWYVGASAISIFQNAYHLKNVIGEVIDFAATTTFTNTFLGATALEDIRIKNVGANLNLSWNTNLSYASLLYLVLNLQNVSGKTLTIGATNKSKLEATTDGQAALAAAQTIGWTIA